MEINSGWFMCGVRGTPFRRINKDSIVGKLGRGRAVIKPLSVSR